MCILCFYHHESYIYWNWLYCLSTQFNLLILYSCTYLGSSAARLFGPPALWSCKMSLVWSGWQFRGPAPLFYHWMILSQYLVLHIFQLLICIIYLARLAIIALSVLHLAWWKKDRRKKTAMPQTFDSSRTEQSTCSKSLPAQGRTDVSFPLTSKK